MSLLQNKRILLGITGGIAAYKGAELCRLLVKAGCDVSVIMTDSAQRFVSPMTLEVLSGRPVGTSLWETIDDATASQRQIHHTEAGRHADCVVVAPATANFIGKVANGLADDLLTTIIMASHIPVLVCPAMNVEMLHNPLVERNFSRLREISRYRFVSPGTGELACGVVGEGRLAEPADIVSHLTALLSPKDFEGRRILITAGPTREHLDPVRYLSNPSTGKMGYALAQAASDRGANVCLVSGPVQITPPTGVQLVSIQSAEEMANAVFHRMSATDVLIMAAAVSDWRSAEYHPHKVKKDLASNDTSQQIILTRTRDILLETARFQQVVRVGFAAETNHIQEHAREKLLRKKLDLIIANDVSAPNQTQTGFGVDTNAGYFVFSDERVEYIPLMSKIEFAHRILDAVLSVQKSEVP